MKLINLEEYSSLDNELNEFVFLCNKNNYLPTREDFEDVIDANLTGAFRVAKRATKGLLKLKRGRLIFVGSVVGSVGAAGQVNYAASKSGLVGMARSFARELGSRGITANMIENAYTVGPSSNDKRRVHTTSAPSAQNPESPIMKY